MIAKISKLIKTGHFMLRQQWGWKIEDKLSKSLLKSTKPLQVKKLLLTSYELIKKIVGMKAKRLA